MAVTLLESTIHLTTTTMWKQSDRLTVVSKDAIVWLVNFLSPYRKVTNNLQGEKYPTLPLALPSICKLRKHLQPQVTDTFPQAMLRSRAWTFFQAKIKPTMKQMIGTFLGPSFRHLTMLMEEPELRESVCNTLVSIYFTRILNCIPAFGKGAVKGRGPRPGARWPSVWL